MLFCLVTETRPDDCPIMYVSLVSTGDPSTFIEIWGSAVEPGHTIIGKNPVTLDYNRSGDHKVMST